jgi:formiminotetrahydrofolate cyclodeaminase
MCELTYDVWVSKLKQNSNLSLYQLSVQASLQKKMYSKYQLSLSERVQTLHLLMNFLVNRLDKDIKAPFSYPSYVTNCVWNLHEEV